MHIAGHVTGSHVDKDGFRLRGMAISRVDAFSDVVFGFALTLLVVSLEVPKTYAELLVSLRGFVPFAVCFYILMLVWRAHFRFFRRFGLHDTLTVALNAMLLFVVLFYVYPLKFLFSYIAATSFGRGAGYFQSARELQQLMVLFGLGFAAVYGLFAAMNWNGWRQRGVLELNLLEETLARSYVWECGGVALVGLLACVVALLLSPAWSGLAGLTYLLLAVYGRISSRVWRPKLKKAREQTEQDAEAATA